MRSAPLYLLDTNVVSVFGKPMPHPDVMDWIEAAPPRSLAIAWSTVFELQYGIENARNAGSHRTDAYERALGELLDDRRFRVLRPTTEAARIRARMHATPALRNFLLQQPGSRKRPTGEDLTIAATAIAAKAVVVTSNVRDFLAIDKLFPLPGLFDPVAEKCAEPGAPASTMGAGRHRHRKSFPVEGSVEREGPTDCVVENEHRPAASATDGFVRLSVENRHEFRPISGESYR